MPPGTAAAVLSGVAAKLRQDLVLLDADPLYLSAKVADLLVEATVEPEPPHRLTVLTLSPGGAPATDPRVARPPAVSTGPVPGLVPGLIEDSYSQAGLVGLTAAGDWDSGPAPQAVVDRTGPGPLRVRLADAAARGTRRGGAAPARPAV